jgi:hypothetical protein
MELVSMQDFLKMPLQLHGVAVASSRTAQTQPTSYIGQFTKWAEFEQILGVFLVFFFQSVMELNIMKTLS